MPGMVAIRAEHLEKRYRLRTGRAPTLKELILRQLPSGEVVHALKDVTFSVERGQCFGVTVMSCDAASEPSANLYQERWRLVAVTLCSTSGVDQPSEPPRRRVTFGRNSRVAGCVLAE